MDDLSGESFNQRTVAASGKLKNARFFSKYDADRADDAFRAAYKISRAIIRDFPDNAEETEKFINLCREMTEFYNSAGKEEYSGIIRIELERAEENYSALMRRINEEEEQRRKAEEEQRKREEQARLQAEEEQRLKLERERLQAEEEQRRREEQARLQAEEEQRQREERERQQAEEEKRRKEEQERRQAEEEKRRNEEQERLRTAKEKRIQEEEEKRLSALESLPEPDDSLFYWSGSNTLVITKKLLESGENVYTRVFGTAENERLKGGYTLELDEGIKTVPKGAFDCRIGTYFSYDEKKVYWSGPVNIRLPSSIKVIENSAFSCCENLKGLYISGHINNISPDAFYRCKSIAQISSAKNEYKRMCALLGRSPSSMIYVDMGKEKGQMMYLVSTLFLLLGDALYGWLIFKNSAGGFPLKTVIIFSVLCSIFDVMPALITCENKAYKAVYALNSLVMTAMPAAVLYFICGMSFQLFWYAIFPVLVTVVAFVILILLLYIY